MTLARTLVDGEGLLRCYSQHGTDPSRSQTAIRQELLDKLTQFYDAEGVPWTVAFRTGTGESDSELEPAPDELEVDFLQPTEFVRAHLLRYAQRHRNLGNIQIVTDEAPTPSEKSPPHVEWTGCQEFLDLMQATLRDLEEHIHSLNQKENEQFTRSERS